MKRILVFSNTAFSIKKFREHYLSKCTNFSFKIYTPNSRVIFDKKSKNLESDYFISKSFLFNFFQILKLIKKEKTSSVISYSTYYSFIISLCKIFINFDLTVVVAGRGSLFAKKNIILIFFAKLLFRFIFNISNSIIFINPSDKKYFSNIYFQKKMFLIPTEGLEVINLNKKKNNKKNFIFFSRLIKEKGINEYIELAKKIKSKFHNCNFYVAGPNLKEQIGQSKFDYNILEKLSKNKKYIKYLGYISNYKKIYPKMDCLVSPSYEEGAGTSVMEAMQSKLYIIAYKNNGHNFVLKGTDNFICKKNNIENLQTGVENFLKMDENKITSIANVSKKKILQNFSSEIVSKKINLILKKRLGYKSRLSIINFYQTNESDSVYPRHLYLSKKIKNDFHVKIYGCKKNHYILKKKRLSKNIIWVNSLKYNNSLLGRFISIIYFNFYLIFFVKKIRNDEFIYITDNISCYIFLMLRFFIPGKIIYEVRDIYPETLIEFYNLNKFITNSFKVIELFILKKTNYLVSSLQNYNLYIKKNKLDIKSFFLPNFIEKFKKNNVINNNFSYIGSITRATNMNDLLNFFFIIKKKYESANLYIVSRGNIFLEYKNRYKDNSSIKFIYMKNKFIVNSIVKKSKFGFISYFRNKEIYDYGISPRKLSFYLPNGVIPILISNAKHLKFYLDDLFIFRSKSEVLKKIKKILNLKNINKKINNKINQINYLNNNLSSDFSKYLIYEKK
jgi:galacturonosyltransferase